MGQAAMSDTSIFRLHARQDLHAWAERDWSGGIATNALQGLEQFAVQTRNTTYEITMLSPKTGAVLVRGGQFFPEHTRATLAGCSLGGSILKVGAVQPGFLMELLHEGRRIVTTRVSEIRTISPSPPQ